MGLSAFMQTIEWGLIMHMYLLEARLGLNIGKSRPQILKGFWVFYFQTKYYYALTNQLFTWFFLINEGNTQNWSKHVNIHFIMPIETLLVSHTDHHIIRVSLKIRYAKQNWPRVSTFDENLLQPSLRLQSQLEALLQPLRFGVWSKLKISMNPDSGTCLSQLPRYPSCVWP